jgi:hypothetical protein
MRDSKSIESVLDFITRKDSQFKKMKSLIPMKDIGRRGKFYFEREAWTFLPQHNLPKKVFIFERLRKVKFVGRISYGTAWKTGDIEYRIGYFIVGKINKANGRWIWGQFCPLIPAQDFNKLILKAKKDGVILK